MFFFTSKKIHETVACSFVISVCVYLHVFWISNLLIHRIFWVREMFDLIPWFGPLSGIVFKSGMSAIFVFVLSIFYLKGKDCSQLREKLFHFFLFSIITFLIMTLPFVFTFYVDVIDSV